MPDNYPAQIPPGMLLRAMQSKQDIIAYYNVLIKMTQDQFSIGLLRSILPQEENHLSMFKMLYIDLFREQPELIDSEPPIIESFAEGIRYALMHEMAAYGNYGSIFFTDQNTEVRNTFLQALFDENMHASKLIYIDLIE